MSRTNRDFKKLRRLLQLKRRIKIELCARLSVMRLFLVDQIVQTRRSELSPAWDERFPFKGRELKIFCRGLELASEPQI